MIQTDWLALKPAKEIRSQRVKLIESIYSQCWVTKFYHQIWWSGNGLKLGNKVKSQINGEGNKGEEWRAPTSVGHPEAAANIYTGVVPHHPPIPSLPLQVCHMLIFFPEMAMVSLCWDTSYHRLRLSWKFVVWNSPQETEFLSLFSIPLLHDSLYSLPIFGVCLLFSFIQVSF